MVSPPTWCGGVYYCFVNIKYPAKLLPVSSNFSTMCSVTQLMVRSSTSPIKLFYLVYVHYPPSCIRSLSSILYMITVLHLVYVHCSPSCLCSLSSILSTFTVLHLVYVHCPPSCLHSLSSILSTSIVTEIFVRFNYSNFEIDEDTSSLDVYFEVVREVFPGVYVPAEYTFDFQLQVTTITVVGSATGECTVDSYS